jgi:hypothetical protein
MVQVYGNIHIKFFSLSNPRLRSRTFFFQCCKQTKLATEQKKQEERKEMRKQKVTKIKRESSGVFYSLRKAPEIFVQIQLKF